ncbi:MAG: efflux RND transporter periplasmic adaptor subunit [Cyanobacteria bacterium]|nr:efflux RND transporter periplasmic adaptor subunit [Cyanobacteriota bacterium]
MNKRRILQLLLCELLLIFFAGCGEEHGLPAKKEAAEGTDSGIIQLAPQAIQRAGLQTITVQSRSMSDQILTTAEVKANENWVFHISSFVGGRVVRDNVVLGDTIQRGQTLAVVQNLEVAKIQADYIHELHQNEVEIRKAQTRYALAQKNLERERRLLAKGISPRKDYMQAESDAALARADLEGEQEHRIHIKAEGRALLGAYGMKPGSVHSESIRTGTPVTAPRSGVITQKNITLGDMVTPETVMYKVADLSQVWLDITVYPTDLSSVRVGQQVTFTTDSLPGRTFLGRVNYLPPATQEASQTYVARAYLDNSSGLLKPGMFGQAKISQASQQSKPFVPDEAVQKYGKETFVFVKLGNNRFRKQTVQLGEKVSGGYLVNAGLQLGDSVVGKGSFTLKAEMLKSQFAEEEEE